METTTNTKDAILDRLHDEYEALASVLDKLTVEQMIEPDVVGEWSVKDLIAHLVYWNRLPVQEIEAALNGVDPSTLLDRVDDDTTEGSRVDAINAKVVEESYNDSVGDVMANFAHSYQLLLQTVMNLPEIAFDSGSEIEQLLGDTIDNTLNNNTYEHWAEHRVQLEAWIAQQEV
jgi:hypothetical protein